MARQVGLHTGAFDQGAVQDIWDCEIFSPPITNLTGTADVINPHVTGNYIIKTGSANAMTLTAPTPGVDDNLVIAIFSDTLFAHTLTATSLLAGGTALKTTATFPAFRGAGMVLRAFNGVWQVVSSGNGNVASFVVLT